MAQTLLRAKWTRIAKISPLKQEEAKQELQSDNTHQISKKSATQKSTRSIKSDKSDRTEHPRERFQVEKSVRIYQKAKEIEKIEKDFEYNTDEESIYKSFEHDPKGLPHAVTKKFTLNHESNSNKKQVKDMLKRFSEKT